MDYSALKEVKPDENVNISRSLINFIDLDISQPIDFNKALDSLTGNRKLYFSMLSKIEVMALNNCMVAMAEAYREGEWNKMRLSAHTLKSACGYVGAGKLHYSCYFLVKKFL